MCVCVCLTQLYVFSSEYFRVLFFNQTVQVECRMTCLNGGHCEAGACVCQQGYRGLNCEEVVPGMCLALVYYNYPSKLL